ncbi:MAG TPA: hypothetical protein PKM72_11055, partial [Nitrospirales bacterium]|nr:hypothetical protein [Nitrospirales bacterium]
MMEPDFPLDPATGGDFSEEDGIWTGSFDILKPSGFGQFSVSDLMGTFSSLPQSLLAISLIFTVIAFIPTHLAVPFKG